MIIGVEEVGERDKEKLELIRAHWAHMLKYNTEPH
jgi:hypothetical protein